MTLYALPPGTDFARNFSSGFWARYGARPAAEIAQIQILLNNRRSLRAVEDALLQGAPAAALLPRLQVLAELGADPLGHADLPPQIDPLRRDLRLTRLVERYLETEGAERTAPPAAAPDMARALASLLDELDEEGIDAKALDNATNGEHAEHWARTLAFMELIRTHWPAIAAEAEGGALGPKDRQRKVIEAQIATWKSAPPKHPVIAAASTGSVATTALMLAAIAELPNGAVVMPGFDRQLDPQIWQTLADGSCPEHPQAPFLRLLSLSGAAPDGIEDWVTQPAPGPRLNLLHQALRPAPVTDAWHQAAPVLKPDLTEATADVTLLEAPGLRQEAAAIALATRRALETPERTVLILTQDAGLARRITAELARFRIEPDDSLGKPLAQSAPGVFLRLIAEISAGRSGAVRLAGLLHHPLMRPGLSRREHLALTRRYDRLVLRQRAIDPDSGALPDWPEDAQNLPEGAQDWLNAIRDALSPLAEAMAARASLAELAAAHIAAATALSQPDRENPAEVWQGTPGQASEALMARLSRAADAFGPGAVADYPGLLLTLMRSEEIRPEGQTPHPRVLLQSPREARVSRGDLVILAGLNEGGWPRVPAPDPWLSRPMRAAIGLPMPERLIGLSAHDFLQASAAGEVVLSRALKVDGAPSVASRWLIRLETLIAGVDAAETSPTLAAMRARGQELLDLAAHTHLPDEDLIKALPRAARPSPTPPVEARPKTLSVTQVETLVRDAYAIYACKILKLEPLDPLGQSTDYRDRGILIHEVMERFTKATPGPLPENADSILMAEADAVLREQIPFADMRRIWRARIARFARWFLEGEEQRRADRQTTSVEIKGQMVLPQPPGFTVTARADRIDLMSDGGAAIYDYKAGAPPTRSQIDAGFNQQLHLQAAILAEGGFEGLERAHAHLGAYLGLTGSGEGGREVAVRDLASDIQDHLDRLQVLLGHFMRQETGYTARSRVKHLTESGDYDHLARFGEWEAGDD
ncbi:MAG: double-strand break repair protein AddB [Pseudomonadota bacterium]